MDTLQRLTVCVVVWAAGCLWGGPAYAQVFGGTPYVQVCAKTCGDPSGSYGSCMSSPPLSGYAIVNELTALTACSYMPSGSTQYVTSTQGNTRRRQCPQAYPNWKANYPGSSDGGCFGPCTPPTEWDEAAGECVTPQDQCEPLAGQDTGPAEYYAQGAAQDACFNQCQVTAAFQLDESACGMGPGVDVWEGGNQNIWVCLIYRYTGVQCGQQPEMPDGSDTSPNDNETDPPPETCAEGDQGGYVGEDWVCFPPSEPTGVCADGLCDGEKDPRVDSDGDGDIDSEDGHASEQSNADPAPGAAGGGAKPSGDGDTETGSDSTCDPQTQNCDDRSAFTGKCGTAPSCSGDAVQCATAKSVWEMNCQFRPADGTSLAEKIAAGNDPKANEMPWAEGKKKVTDVSTMLVTTESFAGPCISDVQYSIMGHGGSIPLSEMCDELALIGNLMFAGALMFAARVIFVRGG